MNETADLYRRWAREAARGSSPTYERLALAVAEDDSVVRLLESVEFGKRQPNLLLGALRWHGVPVEDPQRCLAWARAHPDRILAVLRTRRIQTNEVARCATILPALAQLPQPLALIEVGASAGLCLLYDCWRYHYTGASVDQWIGPAGSPVTLSCEVDGDVPLPAAVPTIVWRVGLDLNPLDAREPEARRWLQLTPQRPSVPPTARPAFLVAALGVTSSWSIGGLLLSLGPQFTDGLFHTTDPLVGGVSVFALAGSAAIAQLLFRRTQPWAGTAAGSVALATGMALIVGAASSDSSVEPSSPNSRRITSGRHPSIADSIPGMIDRAARSSAQRDHDLVPVLRLRRQETSVHGGSLVRVDIGARPVPISGAVNRRRERLGCRYQHLVTGAPARGAERQHGTEVPSVRGGRQQNPHVVSPRNSLDETLPGGGREDESLQTDPRTGHRLSVRFAGSR